MKYAVQQCVTQFGLASLIHGFRNWKIEEIGCLCSQKVIFEDCYRESWRKSPKKYSFFVCSTAGLAAAHHRCCYAGAAAAGISAGSGWESLDSGDAGADTDSFMYTGSVT